MTRDAKIGLVTLAIAVALLSLNSLREAGVVTFGSQMGLIFTQVHGLRAGDPVTIGGVPRGHVAGIDFAPSDVQETLAPLTGGTTLVRVWVRFDDVRKIPRDSTYAVRSDLNGRRWVEITVTPSEVEIGPDELFFAEASARQEDQFQATLSAFTALGEQTEGLREILSDPEFRLRTKDTASNLRFYSRELRAASAEAPAQLRAFEQTLDQQEVAVLAQIRGFDQKTREVRQRMTEMSPQLTENLKGWSARMSRQGDRLGATLRVAVQKTDEFGGLVDELLQGSLSDEAVRSLVVETRKWARQIEEYRYLAEDLHALTSDPTVRADLKTAIAELRERSVELQNRLDALEKRIDENPLPELLGIPRDPAPTATPGVGPPPTNPATPSPSPEAEASASP